MREQVAVPWIDQIDLALLHATGRSYAGVDRAFCSAFWKRSKATRRRARRSDHGFNANTSGSSSASGAERLRCSELISSLRRLRARQRAGRLPVGLTPADAAVETCSFDGSDAAGLLDAQAASAPCAVGIAAPMR